MIIQMLNSIELKAALIKFLSLKSLSTLQLYAEKNKGRIFLKVSQKYLNSSTRQENSQGV